MKYGKFTNQESNGEIEINLRQIAMLLLKRLWIILLCGIVLAGICFSYARFMIPPRYKSSATLYIHNTSLNVGGTDSPISYSDLTTSQRLVKTYLAIMLTQDSLEMVLEKTGSRYSWGQLRSMITAEAVDDTEVFRITVIATNPYEAAELASAIAEILPERVADIIEGSSVRLVSKPVPELNKIAPNVSRCTLLGFFMGALLCCAVLILLYFLDDVIRDENYITQTYDLPILTRVPDMQYEGSHHYGYYKYGGGVRDEEEDRQNTEGS